MSLGIEHVDPKLTPLTARSAAELLWPKECGTADGWARATDRIYRMARSGRLQPLRDHAGELIDGRQLGLDAERVFNLLSVTRAIAAAPANRKHAETAKRSRHDRPAR